MKILYLGARRENLIEYLISLGDSVVTTEKKITAKSSILENVDWIISYGYRYIIKNDVINRFDKKIVNLHISLLPWNRGADPNLWSFLDNTPKGVTIHFIDSGIDTGEILAQQEMEFCEGETLRSSYNKLTVLIEKLFIAKWREIKEGIIVPSPQVGNGSYHKTADKTKFLELLADDWDTPVNNIILKNMEEKS